jgi:Fe-S-cluster containining protein
LTRQEEKLTRLPEDRPELERRWPGLLAEFLAEIRSPAAPDQVAEALMTEAGFYNLVLGWEDMPTAAQARAWDMIIARLKEAAYRSRPFCVRCGECCRQGAPALYDQDRPALAEAKITRRDLVTHRSGELAFSNQEQKLVVLERERVKLKPAPGSRTCLFLGPGGDACLIYPDRPFQCRVMDCWDPSRFETLLDRPALTRLDLLGTENPLRPIMELHDQRCSLPALAGALAAAFAGDHSALAGALDLILFDLHTREFIARKYSLPFDEMDFFLGRPLSLLSADYGFRAVREPDGGLSLVRMEPGVGG